MSALGAWMRDCFNPESAEQMAIDDESRELLRARYYVGFETALHMGLVGFFSIAALAWNQASRAGLITWIALALITAPAPIFVKMADLPVNEWLKQLWKSELILGVAWRPSRSWRCPRRPGCRPSSVQRSP